jgi:hypothetical protein
VATTTCILILALVVAAGILIAGWHIVVGVLHLSFSIIRALFNWPSLLLILIALIVVWIVFMR